ncbi:MAG: hypothetical protein IPK50_16350 [Fibrobacterota bacterium]|nr:hypothetical protein [Fibrobacterota bacterium]QQS03853.1 MAG: hypothetical protein IPK50_16350 [Fibrobacterota bacterium]
MHTIRLSIPSKQNRIPFLLSLVLLLGVSFLCHDQFLFSKVDHGATGLEFLPGFLISPVLWITLGWIPVVWLTKGTGERLKLVGLTLLVAPLPALWQAVALERFQGQLLQNLAFNHAWILGFHLAAPAAGVLVAHALFHLLLTRN